MPRTPGKPLPSRLTWFYNDHLGAARAGMNASQAIIWQIEAMTGLGDNIQSDPIGLKGGVKTYGYAFQGPLYYTYRDRLTPRHADRAAWAASTYTGRMAPAGN